MFSTVTYEALGDEFLKIAGLTTEEAAQFKKVIKEQARFERMSRDGKMSDADKAAHRSNTERIKQYTAKRRGDATDLPGWAKDPKGAQPEANTRRSPPPPKGGSSARPGGRPWWETGGYAQDAKGQGAGRAGSRRGSAWDGWRSGYGRSEGQKPPPRPGASAKPPPRDDPFGGDSVEDWIKKKKQQWAADDAKWKADRAASDKKWADTKARWKAEDDAWRASSNKRWGTGSSPSSGGGASSWADDIGKKAPKPAAARGLGQYAVPIGIGAAGLAGLGAYAYWKSRQPKPPPVAEARL